MLYRQSAQLTPPSRLPRLLLPLAVSKLHNLYTHLTLTSQELTPWRFDHQLNQLLMIWHKTTLHYKLLVRPRQLHYFRRHLVQLTL